MLSTDGDALLIQVAGTPHKNVWGGPAGEWRTHPDIPIISASGDCMFCVVHLHSRRMAWRLKQPHVVLRVYLSPLVCTVKRIMPSHKAYFHHPPWIRKVSQWRKFDSKPSIRGRGGSGERRNPSWISTSRQWHSAPQPYLQFHGLQVSTQIFRCSIIHDRDRQFLITSQQANCFPRVQIKQRSRIGLEVSSAITDGVSRLCKSNNGFIVLTTQAVRLNSLAWRQIAVREFDNHSLHMCACRYDESSWGSERRPQIVHRQTSDCEFDQSRGRGPMHQPAHRSAWAGKSVNLSPGTNEEVLISNV